MELFEFAKGKGYAAIDATKVEGVYVQRQRFPTMRLVGRLEDHDYHKTFLERGRVIVQTVTGNKYVARVSGELDGYYSATDFREAHAMAREVAKELASTITLIECGKRNGYAAIDATKIEGVYVEHERYRDVTQDSDGAYRKDFGGRWRVVVSTVTGNKYVAGIYKNDRQAMNLAKEIAKEIASIE